MATTHSLFPKTVPTIAVPNPHKRKPSLSKTLLTGGGNATEGTDGVPVPPIPLEHRYPPPESPPLFGYAVTAESPIDGIRANKHPQRSSSIYPVADASNNQMSSEQRSSNDSGYKSSSPEHPKSPVVPIRSMFPVYNPSIPLVQQNYYPQRPIPAQLSHPWTTHISRPSYGGEMATPLDRAIGPRSATPSVANFPLDNLTPRVSSQRELETLWEATHGMEPNAHVKAFDLELARTEEAKFTLGSDPTTPFYTLITYDTNELAVSKNNPRKPTVSCDVSINSLESGSRRYPPNDGLITFIFPKTAAMLAINQSNELAKEHELAPTHRDEIQAAAVRRAADQEASNLRWNDVFHRYELEHPAIGRSAHGANFVTSPNSPQNHEIPSVHITITNDEGDSSTLPIITVTNPHRQTNNDADSVSEAFGANVSGIRMSTIPQSDTDRPLACLDFNIRMLNIDAHQILSLMPSLFAIDSIISAIFSVAVADQVTNPVMASMELWTPKPKRGMTSFRAGAGMGGPRGPMSDAGVSVAGSVLFATLAEREEAEEEAKEMLKLHREDIKKSKTKPKPSRTWYGRRQRSRSPSGRNKKSKKVMMGEFDLEKLGTYQSGERKGQQLPGVTRSLLAVMIGGLRFVVWFLTLIVQFLAWLMVSVTRGVTSEKF